MIPGVRGKVSPPRRMMRDGRVYVCVRACVYACTSVIQRVIIRLTCILMLDSKNFVADALIVPSMEIRRILNASTRR